MKQLPFYLLLLLAALHANAQTDSTVVPAVTDSTKTVSTLTFASQYSNNANYYGQRAEESIPYVAAGLTYRNRSGLYLSALGYRLLHDSGALVSAFNAGAGYAFTLNKHWSGDLSYSHTFYPAYSPFLQASNPDNVSASLTYDHFLATKLNVDYAFGKTKDVFVTLGTGKLINLGSLGKKDLITLTPSIDVVAGTQHFYQTYLVEKKLRDSVLGILLTPIVGQPASQSPTTTTTGSTKFNPISYNLKIPLAYNRAHYLFELAYQLSVLSQQAQTMPGKVNSFGSISFYYQF